MARGAIEDGRGRRLRLAGALAAGLVAAGLGAAGGFAVPAPARAAAADPAARQIEAFDAALISTMKEARALGPEGRYRKLAPAVARAFEIPVMIQFAVGPTWSSFTPAQKEALARAFERLTVASYAHSFNAYSGERFVVEPQVVTRGPDKVVRTQLVSPGSAPVDISYRMRDYGGTWKIIDVFYGGSISQLTTRRADFASVLTKGGAPALIAHLNALADNQLK